MAGPDLSSFMDFMDDTEDDGGFDSPPMPSRKYPKEVGGHSYRIPSPDARVGLRLSALADLTFKHSKGIELNEVDVKRLRLDDAEEAEFVEQVLSTEVVAQMVDDGVKIEHMKRLAMYAFLFFGVSREAADKAVEGGLFRGKGASSTEATNRAQRRATTTKKRTSGDSSASRKTTPTV